jgi:hypothetical protein
MTMLSMRLLQAPGPLVPVREATPAPRVPIRTTVRTYALADANAALGALRDGSLSGAAVLVPGR